MSNIFILTRLQIVQAIGGVRAAIEKRTGANGAMAGTVIIAILALGGLGYLGYAAYGLVGRYGLAPTAYNVVFLACGLLTFTFSLPTVLGSFFGSSDINDLLPLPVSPFSIVLAKALGVLSTSYLWTLIFLAGPLAGWGIAAGVSMRYWVVYVVIVLLAPCMPVSYAGILSMLIATIFKRVRRKDAITTLTTIISLLVSVGLYFVINHFNAGAGIQDALGDAAGVMGSVVMAFPAYGFAVYALIHPDPLGVWMFVLLSVASFVLFVVVARLLYMRIVTSLSSSGAQAVAYDGSAEQRETPVLKALVLTEVKKVTRNSSVLLNYVVYPLVIAPILFGFMLFSDSMSDMFEKIQSLGDASKTAGIALAFAMFLVAISTCSNRIAATGVSREGSNWSHMKVIPVPMETQVLAKVITHFIVSALICIVIMGAFGYILVTKLSISVLIVLSGLVLMMGGAWLASCACAWYESRSPNVSWGNDGDVNVKTLGGGGAELRAFLIGFVYAMLPLLVSPLVGLDPYVFMPVLAIAGVALAVVLGRLLLGKASKNIEVFE